MMSFGFASSMFDFMTFGSILWLFGESEHLFQTGWFVESLMTQTLIIHVIRTNRIPFLQSRASAPLIATTIAIMAIGVLLPISPVAPALGFVPLPGLYWPLLALTLLLYMALTQLVKVALRRWIQSGAQRPTTAAATMRARYHPVNIAQQHLAAYREVLARTANKTQT